MRMTPDEVKAEIAAGRIAAITLDTSVFDGSNNGLEHGALARLKQFRRSKVRCVLSDVVIGEVTAHIESDARAAQGKVRTAMRGVGMAWQTSRERRDEATQVLFGGVTPEDCARARVSAFVESAEITVIPSAKFADIGRLLQGYFESKPPFSTTSAKKNEFPDAIALHSLERWAESEKAKVLVVSKDGDWAGFCESSEYLVPVGDLGEALSYFHQDASVICSMLSQRALAGFEELNDAVTNALARDIDHIQFAPEASAAYYYEPDVFDVALSSFEFVPQVGDNQLLFQPVDTGDDEGYLVVEASVRISVDVSCSFTFFVEDPWDKDNVPIGDISVTRRVSVDAKVFITFEGDFANAPTVDGVEVEISDRYKSVDFGDVSPDGSAD